MFTYLDPLLELDPLTRVGLANKGLDLSTKVGPAAQGWTHGKRFLHCEDFL